MSTSPRVIIARKVEDALERFQLTRNTSCESHWFDVSTAGTGSGGSVWLNPSPSLGGLASFWLVPELLKIVNDHQGDSESLIQLLRG